MKKVVTVTKNDIENGQRAECELCPVALALKRIFKKAPCVSVDGFDAEVYCYDNDVNTEVIVARLPAVAKKFVEAFDHGQTVAPFKFTADFK